MICREFLLFVDDWAAGQLSAGQAARMAAHRDVCPACARAERGERRLRALWRDLPPLPDAPEVWPGLAARLTLSSSGRRHRGFPAGGSAITAATALCLLAAALVLLPRPLTDQKVGNPPINEDRVAHMVTEIGWSGFSEDAPPPETRTIRRRERALLLGSGE